MKIKVERLGTVAGSILGLAGVTFIGGFTFAMLDDLSRSSVGQRAKAFVDGHLGLFAAGAGVLATVALIAFMYRYLERNRIQTVRGFIEFVGTQQLEINKLKEVLAQNAQTVRLEPGERSALKAELMQSLQSSFKDENTVSRVSEALAVVVRRLKEETEEVRRRANINLIIGTAIAAVGLMFLLYYVLTFQTADNEAWSETLVKAIPRLTLVTVIEVLAYFFLGLYRFGTYEIKYYQNELTNVELWSVSYLHSLLLKDAELTKEMAKKLASTERNFVLKKGESAAVLLKGGGDDEVKEGLRTLADLIKAIRGKGSEKEDK